MNSTLIHAAGLRCRTFDELPDGALPKFVVVLNHGFGASGDDLADFGPMLLESSDLIAGACRFVFPEAPIDLTPMGMPGGRAWWPINMARLAEMHATHDFTALTKLEPPGMTAAADQFADCISTLMTEWRLPPERLILGGFSQGAMVCTHVTLTQILSPVLLALFSGTLLWSERWTELASSHPGTRVLQSHGDQDMILPMAAARSLSELLTAAGFQTEFLPFRGPHTIPMPVLERFRARIEDVIGEYRES